MSEMKIRTLLPGLLLLLQSAAWAQSASASMRKARAAVDKGDYEIGAVEYGKVLKDDSSHIEANLEYGLLLFEFLNNPSKGGYYIKKAEKHCRKDTAPEILFGLGRYNHHISKYDEAIRYYQRLITHLDEQNPEGQALIREIQRNISNCRYAMEGHDVNRTRVKIRNAGPGINTLYPEYVPVVTPDGQTMIFTSRRKISESSTINDEEGGFYEDMFIAQRGADGTFTNPQAFSLHSSKIPGQSDRHESVVSLSLVNNNLYTFFDGHLYESARRDNQWGAPVLLEDTLSGKFEFRNHVCISHDGQTLFFSASREGGFGGLDIYKSIKQPDGTWGPAENLGQLVNTEEDDNAPQASVDESILYFASKGHPGFGGYDLFRTEYKNGSWTPAENLGKPFSSPGDDIYLIMTDTAGTKGYFSSSRPGGFGDMDIYEIVYELPFEKFSVDPKGRIAISLPDTVYVGDTVNLAASASAEAGQVGSYYWQVYDTVLRKPGNPVAYRFIRPGPVTVRTHAELVDIDRSLVGAEKRIVVAEREALPVAATGTYTATTPTTTAGTGDATVAPDALETVYFDLNQAGLDPEGKAALDRTAETLKKAPAMKIEVAGYSDARGAEAYNRALSARRAQAVARYLRKNGVPAKQIRRTSGYGEQNIVNRCAEGVECSDQEHAANRRVELKWIEGSK